MALERLRAAEEARSREVPAQTVSGNETLVLIKIWTGYGNDSGGQVLAGETSGKAPCFTVRVNGLHHHPTFSLLSVERQCGSSDTIPIPSMYADTDASSLISSREC